jgi:hypothetical protein
MTGALPEAAALELWSAERLGLETGLGKRRIYRLHAEAGLPAVVLNGRLWFRPADVAAYFAQHLEDGKAA